MSLTLHKVASSHDDVIDDAGAGSVVFTFVCDDVSKLVTSSSINRSSSVAAGRSIESSEVKYAGHSWTVVCTRKVSYVHNYTHRTS